jgi:hypothetical protein
VLVAEVTGLLEKRQGIDVDGGGRGGARVRSAIWTRTHALDGLKLL